jgi:rfaE bifunctional protein kinase chain/domain/rfaE bifunctional protein nucleotidyltransferase chain/domain
MFAHKVKTLEDLVKAVGPRPRNKTVIMCHGVFDIVHPGHLRHLMYAKEKADILVASLTADAHITKADHRPYVPQGLRAQNLAALEMVDYVIIDTNPTPIETIRCLQPDYFAKGYEYFAEGIPPRTMEEMAALEAYGGEIVFTPGDIVYSSSKLIELQAPRIAVDKLLSLMESEGVDFGDLSKAVTNFAGIKVHVVGDTIVDGYSDCTLLGPAAKYPAFSVRLERTERFAGGAAIVARHLRRAGAEVSFSTILGEDPLKEFVLNELHEAGVVCFPVIDRTRPTTYKERFTTDGHKLLQVDRVDNRPISDKALRVIGDTVRTSGADIYIMSDFRHGIFNRESIPRIVGLITTGALKVADSQVSNRWGNILEFTELDLITPNEREARFALGDQDTIVRPLALKLYREAKCRNLILKLGERGTLTYRRAGDEPRDFFALESFADRVTDPIGAGDALLAYAALALSSTGNIVIASMLGSLAAAVACERQGNIPVAPAEVEQKVHTLERRARYE